MDKIIAVYIITNVDNNKCYIGSAIDIAGRWKKHKRDLCNGKHHSVLLQRAWDKYGADSFEFKIIEKSNKEIIIEREQHYLDTLSPEYNICKKAGSLLGFHHSNETREQMSKARSGEQNPNYGRRLSRDYKRRLSLAHRGILLSEEHKRKIGERMKLVWEKRKALWNH